MSEDLRQAGDGDSRLRSIVQDCERRLGEGEPLSDADILAAYPELHAELTAELEKLRAVREAFAAAGEPAPTAIVASSGHAADQRDRQSASTQIRCPSCSKRLELNETDAAQHLRITCGQCGFTCHVTSPGVADTLAPFQELGHFQLLAEVGRGGFGTVWKAYDMKLDRTVAIKIPRRQIGLDDPSRQFEREARTVAQLRHPHIVPVYEVSRVEDTVFIVADYIEGVSLAEYLEAGPLEPVDAVRCLEKIAAAVHYAHEQGVVHRDLKPHNVLLDVAGEPFVTDFGLASSEATEVTITLDGQILGTPAYMSPEQAQGSESVDPRADVYSLGVLMFELLTGELPFRGSVSDIIYQVVHAESPSPRQLRRSVPRDLETICLKCLEKRPDQRYQTAAELADDLRRWRVHEPIHARPVGVAGRAVRWTRRKPAVATLIGLVAIVSLAGLAGIVWQWRQTAAALAQMEVEKERAQRNKNQARRAVDELLVQVADIELANEPGFSRIREGLLLKAAGYLQQIVAENEGSGLIELDAVQASRRLAKLMSDLGRMEEASAYLDKADQLLDAVAANPTVPKSALEVERARLALTRTEIVWFARFRTSLGHPDPAVIAELQRAVDTLAAIRAENAELLDIRLLIAEARQQMVMIRASTFDPETASVVEASATAWQDVLELDPDHQDALAGLAECHRSLARFEALQGRSGAAQSQAESAVELAERLVELDGGRIANRSLLGSTLVLLGKVHYGNEDLAAAYPYYTRADEVFQRLVDDFPRMRTNRYALAVCHLDLIVVAGMHRGVDEAQTHFDRCVEIAGQLRDEDPGNVEIALLPAQASLGLGTVFMQRQDLDAAEKALATAIGQIEPLVEGSEDDNLPMMLLQARGRRGETLRRLGRLEEALRSLDDAIDVGEQLVARLPAHAFIRNDLESIRQVRALVIEAQTGDDE